MRPVPDYRLYLVTDRAACLGRALLDVVGQAVASGAGLVQLREKKLGTREFVELARALKALLEPRNVPLVINDRLDVALAVDADGLHLGQDDLHPAQARALMGPRKLIGLSVSNLEEAQAARELDLDYLGAGPVHPTATKLDAKPVLGLDGLAGVVKASRFPVLGIGGIGPDNCAGVIRAGAKGVAVVSAVCSAGDPGAAAREILREVESAASGRGRD